MGVDRDISTAYCWSSSADVVDWLDMCLIISSTVAVCDWCFRSLLWLLMIGGFRSSTVPSVVLCGTDGLLCFDCRHPPFWNFNSAIPIDVVRVKSSVDGFFNPTGVPMWVSVNKFNLVPKRIMSESVSMF